MSSRTRIFAAVTLLVSCLASPAAWAQAQNLEAGKSPSQLFAGTCTACHKSPRGLLKTVAPGALSGFLGEHYTTGGDMASQLATYLISNGASDKSKQGADKPGTDKQNDQADRPGRKNRNAPAQEAARPEDAPPAGEGGRQGRKRQARPGEASEEGRPVANAPAQGGSERGPDGRKTSAKQRSKLGKPPAVEEPSMANEPPKAEPAKADVEDKPTAEPKQEMGSSAAKPDAGSKAGDAVKSEPAKSEAAKSDTPKDADVAVKPAARPVPTAAPIAASAPAAPGAAGAPEQAASQPQPKATSVSPPSAVTAASAPQPAARVPAGPPAPPISQ